MHQQQQQSRQLPKPNLQHRIPDKVRTRRILVFQIRHARIRQHPRLRRKTLQHDPQRNLRQCTRLSTLPRPGGIRHSAPMRTSGPIEAQHGHRCPRNHVFCYNGWLPGPPDTEPDEFGVIGNRDDAGWGYWCWPSHQSGLYAGPPAEWSEILRTLQILPSGSWSACGLNSSPAGGRVQKWSRLTK